MVGPRRLLDEQKIHLVFELSLWLKGAFALSEVIAGVAAYFISQQFLLSMVLWVTKEEFAEDPQDIIANSLLHAVQNFSVSTQKFVALYLLGHGVIKLWLIIGLLRRRLWYYPVAMVVFASFIAYQLYRYTFSHSVWLLLITVLDIIVVALTWHEYRFMRSVPQTVDSRL
jgi:uncharacterized membrane protein